MILPLFYDRPPAYRQPSLKLEWVLTTANATGTFNRIYFIINFRFNYQLIVIANQSYCSAYKLFSILQF
jgi:hypothetical protein